MDCTLIVARATKFIRGEGALYGFDARVERRYKYTV